MGKPSSVPSKSTTKFKGSAKQILLTRQLRKLGKILIAIASLGSWWFLHVKSFHPNNPWSSVFQNGSVDTKNHVDSSQSRINESRAKYMLPPFDWKGWAESEKQYLFLHIGKAGGSTIFCKLCPHTWEGFNVFCKGKDKNAIPFYPEKFGGRRHMAKIITKSDDVKFEVILTSLRNPITRFISAYNYEKSAEAEFDWIHKAEPKFKECFHSYSIEQFLERGLLPSEASDDADPSPHCQKVAIEFTRGRIDKMPSHVTYNFEYYEKQILHISEYRKNTTGRDPARLLAITAESMREDFENLDALFKTGSLPKGNATAANAVAMKATNVGLIAVNYTSIPQTSYRKLCYHLCQDIQAYKRLLYRSENLDDEHVMERISELNQFCPLETIEVRNDCFALVIDG